MWGRKSTDNGVTWLADMTFSDVMTPLPGQPDTSIVTCYAGDYDYASALVNDHISAWVDGRVPIAGSSQQDTFFDQEPAGGGTPTPTPTATPTATPTPGPITLTGNGRKIGGINTSRLTWSGATSANVDVRRQGAGVIATTPNDGRYDDSTGTTGQASFTYKVCEAGTQTCSNTVTVNFGP
jgi:hypothetical protein